MTRSYSYRDHAEVTSMSVGQLAITGAPTLEHISLGNTVTSALADPLRQPRSVAPRGGLLGSPQTR